MTVVVRRQAAGSGELCRRILAALPGWFSVPESVEDYVRAAEANPTFVARLGPDDVGFATVIAHSPHAGEIYVMGVLPDRHRQGIGRRLLAAVEADLAAAGAEFLQVKTLSPARPDPGYARTRAFYEGCGFRVLEEFPLLWGADNPALQLIKALSNPPPAG
ncbi:MAG TPA: GNAT family N-acetyltransferase [Acidimicrobiales bacterium]|nr:GNAT family N-acetyltransferase [Acidimicrobiales bacterium]